MTGSTYAALADEMDRLLQTIEAGAASVAGRWDGWIVAPDFAPSAANLAAYLALRHHDLRDLQRRCMAAGLSSLGRAESRVMPTLRAVLGLLRAASGTPSAAPLPEDAFFAGEARIAARAEALLGPLSPESPVRLMVTLPSEAADDAGFLSRLAGLGVEAVRINAAHDNEAAWGRMIDHVDAAAQATGRRMKVMIDLPGPKIRSGAIRGGKAPGRVQPGDTLSLARPGKLDRVPRGLAAMECTLSQALAAAAPGQRVFIDDGKLGCTVLRAEDWGLLLRIDCGPTEKGYKLKPEKGINFPDTEIRVPALTDDDRDILRFAAARADGIEFSFVQEAADVAALQEALAALRPGDWRRLGLVLKVETARAVRNLPDMVVRAAGRQPTAIMIARGDLAVEIGFARLAEMQEEILWIGEAAQVPVIWATQVMESYLKTGVPSRGEMTDAAMAARAECVMLNKGPYLFEGIAELDRLVRRMNGHIAKKTHWMRPLNSW